MVGLSYGHGVHLCGLRAFSTQKVRRKKNKERNVETTRLLSPPLSTLYIRKIYSNIGTVRRIYIYTFGCFWSLYGWVGWLVCVCSLRAHLESSSCLPSMLHCLYCVHPSPPSPQRAPENRDFCRISGFRRSFWPSLSPG